MKHKGINYDIGTKTLAGGLTRETFDLNIVTREVEIIKNELNCNAIRISGLDLARVTKASEIALSTGLTVWFSPTLQYDNQENTFQYIVQSAAAAEKLRAKNSNLVFVLGCELTVFTSGFIKGDTGPERMKTMFGPLSLIKNMIGLKRTYNRRLNKFLSRAVTEVKKQFHGQITYSSGTWEKADWRLFDIVGIDFYRSSFNKATYVDELRSYKNIGKPLSIMEFGCCAYQGADDKGAMAWAIVDWKKKIPEVKDVHIRDEEVQSKTLAELLQIFEHEEVFAAFVFTFISVNYTHNDDPLYDLDMASYGIVKSVPGKSQNYYKGLPWAPKQAFWRLSELYKNIRS